MVGSKGGFHGSMSCLMQDDQPWVRRERRRACCSKYCRFFFQLIINVLFLSAFCFRDGMEDKSFGANGNNMAKSKEFGRGIQTWSFLLYGYWDGRLLVYFDISYSDLFYPDISHSMKTAELFEHLTLTFDGGWFLG
jgi:hypothetical protein